MHAGVVYDLRFFKETLKSPVMYDKAQFTETVTRFETPQRFLAYLCVEDGTFLAADDSGRLGISCVGDDEIVWERDDERNTYRHVVSDKVVNVVDHDNEGLALEHLDHPVGPRGELDGN